MKKEKWRKEIFTSNKNANYESPASTVMVIQQNITVEDAKDIILHKNALMI